MNCYSKSDVIAIDGDSWTYGIGGLAGTGVYVNITNCYSTGTVNASEGTDDIGGLLGWVDGNTINSYFLVSSGPENGYGTPLTDEQMKQQSSFIGWDFGDIWHICETFNYPKLIWQILPADYLCPDGVDFIDFSFLSSHWMQTDHGDYKGLELTGNRKIDLGEFAILSNWWGQTGCGKCGGADYSGDGNVNWADIEILCDNWLATDYGIIDIEDLYIFSNYWLKGL
jgi:hypothetical protein